MTQHLESRNGAPPWLHGQLPARFSLPKKTASHPRPTRPAPRLTVEADGELLGVVHVYDLGTCCGSGGPWG